MHISERGVFEANRTCSASLKKECFGPWLDGSEHSTYDGARPLIYVSYFIALAWN